VKKSTITLGEAVRSAIEVELAAARFYRALVDGAHDAEGRAFLEDLARQEDHHAEAIERTWTDLADGRLPVGTDHQVDLVETAPEWRYADGIGYLQALQIAREAEMHAWLYYDALADVSKGTLGDFFWNLARVEEQHVKALDERLATLR
jgi:rubrerythrin